MSKHRYVAQAYYGHSSEWQTISRVDSFDEANDALNGELDEADRYDEIVDVRIVDLFSNRVWEV